MQPTIERPSNPDAEDEGYDAKRQRALDEETTRDEMRAKAEAQAVQAAARALGLSDAATIANLHNLYQLGYMDGVFEASREAIS